MIPNIGTKNFFLKRERERVREKERERKERRKQRKEERKIEVKDNMIQQGSNDKCVGTHLALKRNMVMILSAVLLDMVAT